MQWIVDSSPWKPTLGKSTPLNKEIRVEVVTSTPIEEVAPVSKPAPPHMAAMFSASLTLFLIA